MSIVCRTNFMVHPPTSRFARREKVGEVRNHLKHFLVLRHPWLHPGFADSISRWHGMPRTTVATGLVAVPTAADGNFCSRRGVPTGRFPRGAWPRPHRSLPLRNDDARRFANG